MNVRHHKLERIIRFEYNIFERMFCDKSKRDRIIRHIANLLYYKIYFMYYNGMINESKKLFMINCNNAYYIKHINYFDKLY
jgi:hypothetical protein